MLPLDSVGNITVLHAIIISMISQTTINKTTINNYVEMCIKFGKELKHAWVSERTTSVHQISY